MPPAANLEEWYHETCGECGIPWDTPSPDCPKRIYNRHPLIPIEPVRKRDEAQGRERGLVLARQFVLELYPPVDDPRHPHTVTEMREMLSQMLTIAEFLSGEPTQSEEEVLIQLLKAVKEIRDAMP